MSSASIASEHTTRSPSAAAVDMKLEVVVIPVSDLYRAKHFYGGLGWRLDADLTLGAERRVVQMTPAGSDCSIHFGKGITKAVPGSAQGMILVVYDMESARAELIGHGVAVSEAFHFGANGPVPARTRKVAPTPHGLPSTTQMATAGCSRRSRRGFRDEDSAMTSGP